MDAYISLWVFITLMVATPGPANLLLMSAGASQGYIRTLPFLLGLIIGKLILNIAVAFGLATVMIKYPTITNVLAYLSATLMIFLAMKNWKKKENGKGSEKKYGIFYGMLIHPLSPKTWTMSTLAYTQFAQGFNTDFDTYALIPLSFLILQATFHSVWCCAGALLKNKMNDNIIMTRILVILTIVVVLWALFQ